MKVLVVVPSYAPIVGGTETFVRKLAIKLNAMGIYTDIMTFNMNEKWKPVCREAKETDGFKVFKIPAFNPFSFFPINPLSWILGANVIPKPNFTKRFENYDIIHFCDEVDLSLPLFSIFAQKPKIMQCLTPSALESIGRNYFKKKIFRQVADFYIISFSFQIKVFSDMGIPTFKISTLTSSGVDLETFRPDETKKLDDLILFVGRITEMKGVHILLQALSYLKIPTQMAVIGPIDRDNPRYTERVERMCHSINKKGTHKVKFLGSLNENDLVLWYQKATMLVRPDLEGISGGLTSLEALACGTPVIGTGNDVVKDGVNGILVPPSNAKKLADALELLLENKELRKKYGNEGRSMVELHFSFDLLVKNLVQIYEKLLIKDNKPMKASLWK